MDIRQIPQIRLLIRAALAEERSQRQALAGVRELGSLIRTEDFAALWRDEQRKQRGKGRA